MPENDIDEIGPLLRDLPAPAARMVLEAQTVVLDFKKLLVQRQKLRRVLLALRRELLLRMRQNFFAMSQEMVTVGMHSKISQFDRLFPQDLRIFLARTSTGAASLRKAVSPVQFTTGPNLRRYPRPATREIAVTR